MAATTLRWTAGRTSLLISVGGLALVTAYCALLVWAMDNTRYDTWAALVFAPVIVAASVPVIVHVTRHDAEPVATLMLAALGVRLVAALVRYFVVFEVYGGNADASRYDDRGAALANAFHDGSIGLRELLPLDTGTEFLDRLTATLYALVGPSRLGGFLVFAWLSWWGLVLCYRAALIGFPEIDRRRYAVLLFFMPSLLFWPSSIGKEAWMVLTIGIAAYGAARLLTRQRWGYVVSAIGVTGAGLVRPHVAAMLTAGLLVAFVLRRAPARSTFGPLGRLVGALVLSAAMAFAFSQAVKYFFGDTDIGGAEAVTGALDRAEVQTARGGSEIDANRPNSPLEYPEALGSTLFRPTILEADNAGTLVAAVETTLVLGLAVVGWRRLRHVPRLLVRRPYVLYAVVIIGVFGFAWSTIGNLGILTRQRVQIWPFVLLLLAAPATLAPWPPRPASSGRVTVRRSLSAPV